MSVTVRDAVEADAETLGAIVDLPADALRNVVHDRTVRLAVERSTDPGPFADVAGHDPSDPDEGPESDARTEPDAQTGRDARTERDADPGDSASADSSADDATESVLGFVAFDVRGGRVHVTQLAGDAAVAERLLAEPIRFAVSEGLEVEFVVPDVDDSAASAAEAAGFETVGAGPSFEGEPTTRYRFRPGA
ncbi:hypothetical protein [Halobellus sp. GM3]|uniref:hypothetical protein n=1 Tax=Halobellus sp. GM3 TaxID=3458410 RepID=UPI00403E0297